ncbi:MAG: hypothetical protein IJX28_03050 [Clostridia bacterium]|nr:hypothetical protein [Clostridia bacterium]
MGAKRGFASEEYQRDFPELNKCPDCETFFADLYCPLCGKECPEEMRAGNRKPAKKVKSRGNGDGRVYFVPWYFSTWFIIMMCFLQPIIGLILTWAGYWKRGWKIFATVLMATPYLLVALGMVLGALGPILFPEELPVNLELTQTEYVELCREVTAEDLYRNAAEYEGDYVTLTVVIDAIGVDEYEYESDYNRYYLCHVEENGRTWEFLLRDWRQDGPVNFAVGDVITLWGQGGGNMEIFHSTKGSLAAPGIHMLYASLANLEAPLAA